MLEHHPGCEQPDDQTSSQVHDGDARKHRLHLALAHRGGTLGGESRRAVAIYIQRGSQVRNIEYPFENQHLLNFCS